jgi:hypothetical protein
LNSILIERSEKISLTLNGPFCLDNIEQYRSEVGEFGIYIIIHGNPENKKFELDDESIIYIGRAPYVGIYTRIIDHHKKITKKERWASQRWDSLRKSINYDASDIWVITAEIKLPSYETAYVEMYLLAKFMDRNGRLPYANTNDI